MKERLRAIEGGRNYAFADMAELCLVLDGVIPPKFKVPDFDKYKGTTCPKNHLKMYCRKMGAYAKDDKLVKPDNTEFAGSFVSVPHSHEHHKNNKKIVTCLRLGLTDLLEELGAEDDDSVLVTLVPKYGKGRVNIRGIKIDFVSD